MRRFMVLNVLILFLCSVISLGCSTGSERSISQSDIPDLIGRWEGYYGRAFPHPVKMEILNDSLEGNVSFSDAAATAFKGKIENGILAVSCDKDRWINIMKLRKDGREMKLECTYKWSEIEGNTTLKKIK
jgi:outer membrane cobalamin receptor